MAVSAEGLGTWVEVVCVKRELASEEARWGREKGWSRAMKKDI